MVNEGTQSRVHITVYDNGQLGSDQKAIVEQTQMGAGARSFYNSQREIKSVADLKGMKILVQQAKLPWPWS